MEGFSASITGTISERQESALLNFPRFNVRKFSHNDSEHWDAFVAASIDGTFLHSRSFMNHHGERFQDESLIITDDKENMIAILPLTFNEQIGTSHPGLTYGGLINKGINAIEAIGVLAAICDYLSNIGISKLIYRSIPYIYHKDRCDEDLYAIWYLGGVLSGRAASSVLSQNRVRALKNRRIRALKKASSFMLTIQHENISNTFWNILEQNLMERFSKTPTHTLEEITGLADKFPENISLITARIEDRIAAGVVVFDTGLVLHLQYITSTNEGRLTNALDAIVDHIASNSQEKIIDFGVSTENQGRKLNFGLHQFKSEFGSGVVNYETYEIPTNYTSHTV